MERPICDANDVNKMRVCASVYDALARKRELEIPQRNLIDVEKRCVKKVVIERNKFRASGYFFPCATIVTEDDARTQYSKVAFYVLGDARDLEAVFVFFERKDEKLELHSRMTRIGALLQPVATVTRGKRKRKETDMEDSYYDENGDGGTDDQLGGSGGSERLEDADDDELSFDSE